VGGQLTTSALGTTNRRPVSAFGSASGARDEPPSADEGLPCGKIRPARARFHGLECGEFGRPSSSRATSERGGLSGAPNAARRQRRPTCVRVLRPRVSWCWACPTRKARAFAENLPGRGDGESSCPDHFERRRLPRYVECTRLRARGHGNVTHAASAERSLDTHSELLPRVTFIWITATQARALDGDAAHTRRSVPRFADLFVEHAPAQLCEIHSSDTLRVQVRCGFAPRTRRRVEVARAHFESTRCEHKVV